MPNASSGWSQPSQATQPSNPVNDLHATTTRSKTNFPMSQTILRTPRFGEILPFFVFDAVPNDHVRFDTSYRMNSYTLASPVFNTIRRHKHYISVPYSCILPNTWSKVFVNPKKGDDTPDDAFPLLNYNSLVKSLESALKGSTFTRFEDYFFTLALFLLVVEARLMESLGLSPFTPAPQFSRAALASSLIDNIMTNLSKVKVTVNVSIDNSGVSTSLANFSLSTIIGTYGIRSLFDVINFYGTSCSLTLSDSSAFQTIKDAVSGALGSDTHDYLYTNVPLNISRVIAYQLGIAQLFTNDNVDDVFTAELWNQNALAISTRLSPSGQPKSFSFNGVPVFYDPYSSVYNSLAVSSLSKGQDVGPSGLYYSALNYFFNLFSLAHPLRYGDYFMSAKPQPLAVGDVTTSPNANGQTSALDTVLSILKTKFLNLVNTVRNTVKSYSIAVYGVSPDDVLPEPKLLSHSVDCIDPTVNVNTAESQGTQNATVISSGESQNEFLSYHSQHAVILGLESFDFIQVYSNAVDKFAFHRDRFDMYIPQLQAIGDQPIKLCELGISSDSDTDVYGWQPNYSEYKQLINHATGAFSSNSLPSWFIEIKPVSQLIDFVNPYVIRHFPSEFDVLYKSLSGFGPSYFHFIESVQNTVNASRPMEFVSGILNQS